jgi:hypothetical protein
MSTHPFPADSGRIILFGSGETSPTGRKIFESVFHTLPASPKLVLLETPAGFELNSPQVIGRVGDFFKHRLQNHTPLVDVVPARKRGTEFSPDNPVVVEPILGADLIFMGPGSPTYAVRQLRDSLAWHYLVASHRLGAVLALASAATVAFSAYTLPVYEIFKVGEDLHWIEGLNFFKPYGLQLVFIPHWNNNEGGDELDTSRCFMGQERFVQLMDMLPDDVTIIGLDEKTALIMDSSKCECQVKGLGKVTLLHTGHKHSISGLPSPLGEKQGVSGTDEDLLIIAQQRDGHYHQYHDGDVFPMSEIGPYTTFHPEDSLPPDIWQKALEDKSSSKLYQGETPPEAVMLLIQARQHARQMQDWDCADDLRKQIEKLGWEIQDTKAGPVSRRLS